MPFWTTVGVPLIAQVPWVRVIPVGRAGEISQVALVTGPLLGPPEPLPEPTAHSSSPLLPSYDLKYSASPAIYNHTATAIHFMVSPAPLNLHHHYTCCQ